MSNTLLIRHLPKTLTLDEKRDLLEHFGADEIWTPSHNHNYVFASFKTHEQAESSLKRLHQLQIGNRRLVVEFSNQPTITREQKRHNESSEAANNIKLFLRKLNAWNSSVDFNQPPPPNLLYKYPEPNPTILINIINALINHKPLYIQLLHLMNKMSLDLPFELNNFNIEKFKNVFNPYFCIEPALNNQIIPETSESEISSGEDSTPKCETRSLKKRTSLLPKTKKRVATMLATATLPKIPKKSPQHKHVFESVCISDQKKIQVNVSKDALNTHNLNQVHTEEVQPISKEFVEESNNEKTQIGSLESISRKQLLENKISFSDMKNLSVFKNYKPGEPSSRLYIKNLAKTTTEQDIYRIYIRFIEDLSDAEKSLFDVRVMQEGRMKGQGFVSFPSVKLAEMALNETNGYILNDKPMVIQFAKSK